MRLTDEQRIALARAAFGRRTAIVQPQPVVASTPQPAQRQPQQQQRPVIRLNLRGRTVEGDDNFKRMVYGYLKLLNQSDEGVKVWNASNMRWISQQNGFGTGEASPGGFDFSAGFMQGYLIFCHELRHCWQMAHGWNMYDGVRIERDANLWAAARCTEAGDLVGAFLGFGIAFEPLTNMMIASRYAEYSQEDS